MHAGSLLRKELSSGETNEYRYDETTGRLSSMSNALSTLSYTYDSDGFVESIATTFSPEGREKDAVVPVPGLWIVRFRSMARASTG